VENIVKNGKEKTKAKPVKKPKVTRRNAETTDLANITVSKITILIKYVSNLVT
jgi:hypothetical protein